MTIRHSTLTLAVAIYFFSIALAANASQITTAGKPAQLDIRVSGEHSIRITLKPLDFEGDFPFNPALAERMYPDPVISLREIDESERRQVGSLFVEIRPNPLKVLVTNTGGREIQELIFDEDGNLTFQIGSQPILGMGEGGPQPGRNWRDRKIEFDRRGRLHEMRPRWQGNAYGSRNPVALMIGTEGWGLFVATPWGQIDLRDPDRGKFIPWQPPEPPEPNDVDSRRRRSQQQSRYTAQIQGRPPVDSIVPGLYDLFVFDAHEPVDLMKDISVISGPAVLPPKWSLGYMQSHRTLEDENQMIEIVETFRRKKIPLDSVVYLGTGFCPRGWNTEQPSFDFNPEVFKSDPAEIIKKLHALNVRMLVHIVPWRRDRLPTLQGTIPVRPGETVDNSHILNYWRQHVDLVKAGIDAWWPDEGDWFNLFERIKRHQLYYQGPLSTTPNVRPWSLHRNGHLGIAQWGGWVWSGDTESSWKTLEGQIAVGINHSLSLSPYWGSDIGGFYPNEELTGELYARWFQFGSFCPSFRSHGRTWWTRLPWGWGLSEMGPRENRDNPLESELNNPAIEPICKKFAELRYQLMPYTYTLAWQARETGMPLMRAMWLQYPDDENARGLGSQYLWGPDILIAPVFTKGATSRDVYLPHGQWYDLWTNESVTGGRIVTRQVDLKTMPVYVRAGAIIPFDPVRQYTGQSVDGPTTLKIYRGANGQFTIYEDDGISLDYLKGRATWTSMSWDDSEQRLIIEPGAPEGETGQPSNRKFKIELLPDGATKIVDYTGRRLEIKF
ncbi:MAG: glycoside hydrolase family 31 protein [Sedimentisphaerales bacterium]|nr:glycoside hydrolase family 31 protein [Sedimentisphaerales bacterium]